MYVCALHASLVSVEARTESRSHWNWICRWLLAFVWYNNVILVSVTDGTEIKHHHHQSKNYSSAYKQLARAGVCVLLWLSVSFMPSLPPTSFLFWDRPSLSYKDWLWVHFAPQVGFRFVILLTRDVFKCSTIGTRLNLKAVPRLRGPTLFYSYYSSSAGAYIVLAQLSKSFLELHLYVEDPLKHGAPTHVYTDPEAERSLRRPKWAGPNSKWVRPSGAVQACGTLVYEVAVAKGTSPAQDEQLLQPSWFRLGKMAVAGASARERLVHWCTQQLRKTFSLDVSEEIIQ